MIIDMDTRICKDVLIRYCDLHAHEIKKETYAALCAAINSLWCELMEKKDDRDRRG